MDKLLSAADLLEKRSIFQKWYDGYLFGGKEVYCPWDVVNYVSALLYRRSARPKNYWKNTSGNGIIRDFVERMGFQVKRKFETLMNGGTIMQVISDELTYDTLHETEEHLWSVLLMTGYLTMADPGEEKDTAALRIPSKEGDTAIPSEEEEAVALRIPNREIAGIFYGTVMKFFSDHVDAGKQKSLMDALWAGDEEAASKGISDFLWQTISYMDYHEDYYHAFLAGIFVGRGYEVESNKERGLGRPDIRLMDHANRRALIIEAKKSREKEQMEQDCVKALKQIADNEYAKNLDGYEVFCYGVAFFQKSALVKKL